MKPVPVLRILRLSATLILSWNRHGPLRSVKPSPERPDPHLSVFFRLHRAPEPAPSSHTGPVLAFLSAGLTHQEEQPCHAETRASTRTSRSGWKTTSRRATKSAVSGRRKRSAAPGR